MTNKQKLEIVKRALEMGDAHINILFHDKREEKNALEAIEELAEMVGVKVYNDGSEDTGVFWFSFEKHEIGVTAFYDEKEIPKAELWMEGTQ